MVCIQFSYRFGRKTIKILILSEIFNPWNFVLFILGPAFSESRQKMGESKASSNLQSDEICDDLISSRPFSALKDVTNADKHRRKSAHKEAVEKTASPSFSTKSLMGKENDEVRIFFRKWTNHRLTQV